MAKVYDSILDLVGKTPLVELKRIEEKEGLQAKLIAKVESFNPAGSVKDRIAKAMIEDAEAKGLLKEGSVIIEPTSGNTGIGLAAAATVKGYRMILTMPETMSVERRNIVKAYGAEVVLTDGTKGMKGAIEKADELAKEIPNSFIAGQFVNPANPATHKKTTGPEIWEDTDGEVDIFVAGVGTGGTITGTGEYLKEKKPEVKIVAVEPASSPVLSEGVSGPQKMRMLSRPENIWQPRKRFSQEFPPEQLCMQQSSLQNERKIKAKPSLCSCRITETDTIPQPCLPNKREQLQILK